MEGKPRVLFLCTGNSCRSQMAEGFLRHLAGNRFEVVSAGLDPSPVDEDTIAAMAEVGVDISSQTAKPIKPFLGQSFAYVISVCDRAVERCPIFPFALRRLDWPFPDPAAIDGPEHVRTATFRRVRDGIREQIEDFLANQR